MFLPDDCFILVKLSLERIRLLRLEVSCSVLMQKVTWVRSKVSLNPVSETLIRLVEVKKESEQRMSCGYVISGFYTPLLFFHCQVDNFIWKQENIHYFIGVSLYTRMPLLSIS